MYLEPATAQQVREIYAKFGATEESIKNDVQHLISWIQKQPHLPNVTDEAMLINFLLQNKTSVETTKAQIEAFYINKTVMADIFTNRDPAQPWFQNSLHTAIMLPMPKLSPENVRICVFRIFKHESADVPDRIEFLRSQQMIVNLLMREEKNCGTILIYDFENISAALLALLLSNGKRFLTINTKILKSRPQQIILLHVHPMIDPFIGVYKGFMKKKLAERVSVWNKEASDLLQIFPKETLPSDYGGSLPSTEELRNQLYDYAYKSRDWFLAEESVKADLTKKPKDMQINNIDSHSGIDGSFRQLGVD